MPKAIHRKHDKLTHVEITEQLQLTLGQLALLASWYEARGEDHYARLVTEAHELINRDIPPF